MPQDLLDEVHQFCEDHPTDEKRVLNGLAEFYREYRIDPDTKGGEPHPTIPGAMFTVSIRYGLIITFRIQREVAKVTIGNVTIAQGMPSE